MKSKLGRGDDQKHRDCGKIKIMIELGDNEGIKKSSWGRGMTFGYVKTF